MVLTNREHITVYGEISSLIFNLQVPLIMFRGIIFFYLENQMKCNNYSSWTKCWPFNVKPGGVYGYHCLLNCYRYNSNNTKPRYRKWRPCGLVILGIQYKWLEEGRKCQHAKDVVVFLVMCRLNGHCAHHEGIRWSGNIVPLILKPGTR
jgi:hypothetical protein